MPDLTKRRPLKMELEPSDDNLLEQLVASLKRIEAGLDGIQELLRSVVTADYRDRAYIRVDEP